MTVSRRINRRGGHMKSEVNAKERKVEGGEERRAG